MGYQLKTWQLVLLVILFPPVGTYFVCTRPKIGIAPKIFALLYTCVALLCTLLLKLPAGTPEINAVSLN